MGGSTEGSDLLLRRLGLLNPEQWPGGVPEGLPFLPEEISSETISKKEAP